MAKSWNGPFQAADYGNALDLSMDFYYAQYSGDLPSNFPVAWRGDSFVSDGADVGVDLSGGWFDAGDLVKFTLPMAYSATTLAWGGIDFKEGYQQSGAYQDLVTHLEFVTDYFLRAYDNGGTVNDVSDDVFYVQVGNPYQWHNRWGAPETAPENDPNLSRVALAASATNPAGDIAGETAAAMASASIVLREDGQTALADQLLAEAKQLFRFAEAYPEMFSDDLTNEFYGSYDSDDELAWGATWLYKATGDATYLTKAEDYAQSLVYTNGGSPTDKTFDWASKSFGVAALLAEATGDQWYFHKLNDYHQVLQNVQHMSDGTSTNAGLSLISSWGSNRYAANAAFIELQYAQLLTERGNSSDAALISELINFGSDQIDYILGDNQSGQSYVVGFGSDYPLQPHHQAASGLDGWDEYDDNVPNLHVLNGALVGGPSDVGNTPGVYTWVDDRTDFVRNEVATDYNAAFSGALAALAQFSGSGSGAPINGTTGNDYLSGTTGNDVINALDGDDIIAATTGNDQINGGNGDDKLDYLGPESIRANFTFTQNANGTVTSTSTQFGTDILTSIEGIWFEADAEWVPMEDLVLTSTVTGTAGTDYLDGTAANELINALDGADIIVATTGNDRINGGNGDDKLDYLGPSGGRANFTFTQNANGTVTATSAYFGTDILSSIEGVWFEADAEWVSMEDLLAPGNRSVMNGVDTSAAWLF